MQASKAMQKRQKEHSEARAFIRLQLGGAVASAASHIRSKRAAALRDGIEEVRTEFADEFGEESVAAFFECVEWWLSDRNNTVAAAALRSYIDAEMAVVACDDGTDDASGDDGDALALEVLEIRDDAVPAQAAPSVDTAAPHVERVGASVPAPARDASPLPKLPTRSTSRGWRSPGTTETAHFYRSYR